MASFFVTYKTHLLTIAGVIAYGVFFALSSSKYVIGKSDVAAMCLNSRLFIIDQTDTSLEYEQLVAFKQTIDTGILPESLNETWIKILVGMPGDVVSVALDGVGVERTDGSSVYYPLDAVPVLEAIEWDQADVVREWRLKKNEVFLIGETKASFDSRFWGPMQTNWIEGTGYAIF